MKRMLRGLVAALAAGLLAVPLAAAPAQAADTPEDIVPQVSWDGTSESWKTELDESMFSVQGLVPWDDPDYRGVQFRNGASVKARLVITLENVTIPQYRQDVLDAGASDPDYFAVSQFYEEFKLTADQGQDTSTFLIPELVGKDYNVFDQIVQPGTTVPVAVRFDFPFDSVGGNVGDDLSWLNFKLVATLTPIPDEPTDSPTETSSEPPTETPTETTPGPTVTETGPTTTESTPGPTVTETGPTTTESTPGPTVTETRPTTTSTGPVVTSTGPTSTQHVAGPVDQGPGQSGGGEPTGNPGSPLASTGANGPLLALSLAGLALIAAGIPALLRHRRRHG